MRTLIIEVESGSKSSRQPFVNEINATAARVLCCIDNGALLDCCYRAGDADDEMPTTISIHHTLQERAKHFLSDFEVQDGAAANRPVYFYSPWLASEALDRLMTNGDNFAA